MLCIIHVESTVPSSELKLRLSACSILCYLKKNHLLQRFQAWKLVFAMKKAAHQGSVQHIPLEGGSGYGQKAKDARLLSSCGFKGAYFFQYPQRYILPWFMPRIGVCSSFIKID